MNLLKYTTRLWLETIFFKIIRLRAFPVWVKFRVAQPAKKELGYEKLLEMNEQYKPQKKAPPSELDVQQKKWASRVAELTDVFQCQDILEVSCGNGRAASALVKGAKNVYATDIVDVLLPEVKKSGVCFSIGDVCGQLPYENNSFDLVYSINSFEHYEHPDVALREIIRVTRPGGILFFTFSPLYYSAWGLHASRRLGMPFPQILFSEAVIQRFVNEKQEEIAESFDAASDRSKIGPYVNGCSIQQYRQIFHAQREALKTLAYVEKVTLDGMPVISDYAGLFKDKAPSFDDFIVSGITFLAKKRAKIG